MIGALLFFINLVITSHLPWTSEYSVAETGNVCYMAVFWLSAALIPFSRCLLVCWHEIKKRSEALRLRPASKYSNSDPIPSMFSMLFSRREQIVRDLGLNRIILICILWCHFLEVSLISVASIKDLNARNFRWNPAKHTIASKAKKPASPADVTSALAPDLLSGGREPELIGSFAKIWWIYSILFLIFINYVFCLKMKRKNLGLGAL